MKKLIFSLFCFLIQMQSGFSIAEDKTRFTVTTVVKGLQHPWSMAFLPNNRMLITERPGRLRLIEHGRLHPQTITGLPKIAAGGQGGLLDVILHPDYQNNAWIYFSYTSESEEGIGTEVARARLEGMKLTHLETLFRVEKKSDGGRHFGSRLVFDNDNYLYISAGERGDRPRAQDINDHAGSIIRLHDDGRVPKDNPFVGKANAKSEIYSYGHRNPQGIALHPITGEVWTHEHGPQGGDEINIVQSGKNYGWPIITHGVNYGWGTKIGEGSHKSGMEQPLYYWDPSIAPSGMAFYYGDKLPQWRGNLFVGSLKFELLVRLELKNNKVIKEERLLVGQYGRIRDVRNGPDGYLYLLTDEDNGSLLRLQPH